MDFFTHKPTVKGIKYVSSQVDKLKSTYILHIKKAFCILKVKLNVLGTQVAI